MTNATAAIEDRSQKLQESQLLASTKTAAPNEIMEMFGLEGVSEKELVEIRNQGIYWRIMSDRIQLLYLFLVVLFVWVIGASMVSLVME